VVSGTLVSAWQARNRTQEYSVL